MTEITVRTRTGTRTHRSHPGAAVTFCGVWLRADSRNFEVGGPVTCRSCGANVNVPATRAPARSVEPTSGTIVIDAGDARPGDVIAGQTILRVDDLGGSVHLVTDEWGGGFKKPKVAAITVERN